jgi:hypothetical protein
MASTDDTRVVTLTQADFIQAITNFLLSINEVPGSPLNITLLLDASNYPSGVSTTPVLTAEWDITANNAC